MLSLLKSLRQYKKEAMLAPFFVSLEVFLEIFIPYLMANIIDIGIKNSNLPYVIKLGIVLLVMAGFSLFFGILAGRYAAISGAGLSKNIRHDIFYNVQNFSFKNIDKFSSSSLVTRLTTDISNVQMAYMMGVRTVARSPIMIIMALIMSMKINLKISLIFLISVPLLAIVLISIAKLAHPYFIKVFKNYDVLNNTVSENINAQRVVKSFVREDYENQKFKNLSKNIYDLFIKAELLVASVLPATQVVIYTVIILILLNGGTSIIVGDMTTGQLTSIIVYALQILTSVITLSIVFILMIIAESSIERINEVLNEKTTMENPENGEKVVKDGSVEFKDVSFSYSDNIQHLSLKNINLKIESGQTIGIIGATGSSKSTLVHLIPRLYDVTQGEILVGGVNVKNYDLEKLRDSVSMVLQKNTLFTGTIAENIKWGNENASMQEVENVCKMACADEFINEFPNKYDEQIYEGGNNVSGGQKQRLCIARSLLKNPKILILDDSTSAVDTKTDARIRQAFAEDLKDTTKIIIAQRISSVENSDKIIVLDDGKVVGYDTPENLLKNNTIYRETYEAQKKGGVIDEN